MRAPSPRPSLPARVRGVGVGRDPDPVLAAAAARDAVGDARLLVVFASDATAALAVGADVPVVGCLTPDRNEVVVAALGGPGLAVSTAAASASAGLREAGAEAA